MSKAEDVVNKKFEQAKSSLKAKYAEYEKMVSERLEKGKSEAVRSFS
ncbi:MAG: hypothetical protein HYU39_07040 [Thaumarchaeota archaeon]|nr:hypothetical protein [Nitrososphaerota archaeon]